MNCCFWRRCLILKGLCLGSFMTEKEKIERLHRLADRLFSPGHPTYSGRDFAPFDIDRVNVHNTKKEFNEELRAVAAIVHHLHGMLHALQISPAIPDTTKEAMISRIQDAVDNAIRGQVRRKKLRGGPAQMTLWFRTSATPAFLRTPTCCFLI